jgi:aquaporin Z
MVINPNNNIESSESDKASLNNYEGLSHEWRRLIAECWGTFILVVITAGGRIVQYNGDASPTSISIAAGLIVMALIYSLGSVSGAHLNPAVTIAFALRRNFHWRRVPLYLAAQIAGGISAAILLKYIFGINDNFGSTIPGPGFSNLMALLIEVLLTMGLIHTILGTASGARNVGNNGGIAVAGFIILAGLWGETLSGASMNPIRTLGPDLIRGDMTTTWIYVFGPIIGAMLGVSLEGLLKGPPTIEGCRAAEGKK